jgi:hypothetical protein
MHWYGDVRRIYKAWYGCNECQFYFRKEKSQWGESIGGETYIPQHNVVEGKTTLAT